MPEERTPTFLQWEEVPSVVGLLRTRSLVARPRTLDECRQVVAYCRDAGLRLCPRGAGRSYGDMALHDRRVLLDLCAMDRILEFDEERGTIRVEAGTRLIDVFKRVHHALFTLPSSPTESHSSVGGAICANVNGKDGWRVGSFGEQVLALRLMRADGEVVSVDRADPLFRAVVGGMGLVGVVVEATLRLRRVPSPYVRVERYPARNLDELLRTLGEVERTHDLLVGWVDAYAHGRNEGRSVIHAARWIERPETEDERRAALDAGYERLDRHRRLGLALHERFGPLLSGMLHAQRQLVPVFNRLYYTKARIERAAKRGTNEEMFVRYSFEASFTVPPAHLVCGTRGYTVQLTCPRGHAREALAEVLGICRASPCPPVTSVLRAHKADDNLVSFSEDGYSLNLEFHPKRRHERGGRVMLDRLYEATSRFGGKIHLAKDQMLRPDQFRRIFPRCDELMEIKREVDPSGLFGSDLAERVGLLDGRARTAPPDTRAVVRDSAPADHPA